MINIYICRNLYIKKMKERDCDQISVILIVIKHNANGLALVFGRGVAVKGGLVVAGLLILS